MQYISAVSLTRNVKDWMATSRHPHFLHIFDHVCNLINERREVLSIVTQQFGNGPFNLVVEDTICFTEHLTLQSSIFISENTLALGDLTFQIADADLWNPRPDWESLHDDRDNIARQLVKLTLNIGLPLLPQSLVSNFSTALVNADRPNTKEIAFKLAGLGAGLTPAGDDVLMGALYAAWIIHPPGIASFLVQEVADTSAPHTTSLSAAWLRSAGRGEAGILWHQLFDALLTVNSSSLQLAIDNILSVGETSGADALAGFFSTMSVWAALRDPK